MEEIVQIISNVGFPIFACVMMFASLDREREAHKTESENMVNAINNNTVVLTKLLERMENNNESE